MPAEQPDIAALTVGIVTAYVSRNHIQAVEMPALIGVVHRALIGLGTGPASAAELDVEKLTSAQIRKSIQSDGLISFIDGKRYQTLKRHLSGHGLDFQAYRQRFGLPADYPATAPSYSARRSELARGLGLGRKSNAALVREAEPMQKVSEALETVEPAADPTAPPRRGRATKDTAEYILPTTAFSRGGPL